MLVITGHRMQQNQAASVAAVRRFIQLVPIKPFRVPPDITSVSIAYEIRVCMTVSIVFEGRYCTRTL